MEIKSIEIDEALKEALIEAGKLVVKEARMFKWEEVSKNADDNLKRRINPKYYPNPTL